MASVPPIRSHWVVPDLPPECNHTPRYSPETIRKLDGGDLEDAPPSDHGGNNDRNQEMVSGDEGAKEVTRD